jgi:hypothetical protein
MAPPSSGKKVAVVLIHGMGEQHPMDTLRGFVRSVWHPASRLFASDGADAYRIWTKPDAVSQSAELRRITTRRTPPLQGRDHGSRVDFFELYWADITADSTWGDFAQWFARLLWRKPMSSVPKRLRPLWGVLWWLALGVAGAPLVALNVAIANPQAMWWCVGSVVLSALVLLVGKSFLVRYFGDVARYVTPSPRNVRVRHAARRRGLELLQALHANPDYERIVVVGHSLGSILAHDIVALAWEEATRRIDMAGPTCAQALQQCEAAAADLDRCADLGGPVSALALRAYRDAQRELLRVLSSGVDGWRVSDLVTLGSPLTHADVLLAESGDELQTKIDARELLRSPPIKEGVPPSFAYAPRSGNGKRFMHHAAAMAATRWTNLYDQPPSAWRFLHGDLISGPLAGLFGPGVLDVAVKPMAKHRLLPQHWMTHNAYWTLLTGTASNASAGHLQALRHALNLTDDPAAEVQLLNLLARS